QNPELAAEVSAKPSHLSSQKTNVDLGHAGAPEPTVQRRKLQLLPRSVLATEKNTTPPSEEEPESAPAAMSEADVKKKIDEDVREFFAVCNLQEAEVYFTNLPDEHHFRLVGKLVASALENRQVSLSLAPPCFGVLLSRSHATRKKNLCTMYQHRRSRQKSRPAPA
ncbi:hypothetical protein DFJ58DRAFT_659978, partial [Suillus subalutaceus]|uniref:uncharacterized protein n=1 Tax=Suillus subalutaceus TaxID=48586 RepID=UPI001B877562